jgi:hypothetical protein
MASAEAAWQTRTAVNDETGVYVRTDDQDARITSIYRYGDKLTVTPYHNVRATIEAQLTAILGYIHSARASFALPLDPDVDLPLPGSKISWTDDSMILPVDAWIRARNLRYDFENEVIYVEGEGAVAA